MAKIFGPLLSLTASGTIAKGLTFSERKSGSQVRWQKKQKDRITSLRTTQRDRFLVARDSFNLLDFGAEEYGFLLFGGRNVNITSLPTSLRAPQFAGYVRDFLN